jgi:protein-disulfide isomerase
MINRIIRKRVLMKYRTLILIAIVSLLAINSAVIALAQTQRGGQRSGPQAPAKTTPTPAKPAATPAARSAGAAQPNALATVNGQTITLADLDPQVRAAVENLEKDMPNFRRDALQARINTLLLQNEAQKRKVTGEQLMDTEVNSRITEPTEAEIKAFYDANKQQIGNAELATVRPQIVSYLKSQAAQKLATEFLTRLRAMHTVTPGAADVNAPNLAPAAVLATVDGTQITAKDFDERLKPHIYKLRREIFEAEMRAIDQRINQVLLEAEAKKRNQTPEQMFKTEVADKVRQPTDAEVAKFYEDNKARIQGDLASLRTDIGNFLRDQQQNRLEGEFAQRLRAGAQLQIFIKEPEPPVQLISADDDPSQGDKAAPVTIVVFTDFQCPSCAQMHPVVEDALKTYGNRARLVVRDFPLAMHPEARKAAEAAGAANAQGKFFEYINLLFKNQSALDVASLKKYASNLGLDRTRFDAALDSGQHAIEVSRDVQDGEAYGVDATPTIFINGVRLRNLTAEGLRAAIDQALARTTNPTLKANQPAKRATP